MSSVATRKIGENAQGRQRSIGHSKRSSIDLEKCSNGRKSTINNVIDNGTNSISCLPTLPGTYAHFKNQQSRPKGIRYKVRQACLSNEDISVSVQDYISYHNTSKGLFPITDLVERIYQDYFMDWQWMLLDKHNILMYGLGCKRNILKTFAGHCLVGEDVILLDSSTKFSLLEDKGVKQLLDMISEKVLGQATIDIFGFSLVVQTQLIVDLLNLHYGRYSSDNSNGNTQYNDSGGTPYISNNNIINAIRTSGGAENNSDRLLISSSLATSNFNHQQQQQQPERRYLPKRVCVSDTQRWGGRYALAQSKLYIIVFDICSPSLCSSISQQCLSLLAECPSVSLIATVENLNSVGCWDREILSRYHWQYCHIPTYRNHTLSQYQLTPLTTINDELNQRFQHHHQHPLITTRSSEQMNYVYHSLDSNNNSFDDNNDDITIEKITSILPSSSSSSSEKSINKKRRRSDTTATGSESSNSEKPLLSSKQNINVSTIAIVPATVIDAHHPYYGCIPAPVPGQYGAYGSAFQALLCSLNQSTIELLEAMCELIITNKRNEAKKATSTQQRNQHKQQQQQPDIGQARRATRTIVAATSAGQDKTKKEDNVSFSELLPVLRPKLIAANDAQLTQKLREFTDHKVLLITCLNNSAEKFVCLRQPYNDAERIYFTISNLIFKKN